MVTEIKQESNRNDNAANHTLSTVQQANTNRHCQNDINHFHMAVFQNHSCKGKIRGIKTQKKSP